MKLGNVVPRRLPDRVGAISMKATRELRVLHLAVEPRGDFRCWPTGDDISSTTTYRVVVIDPGVRTIAATPTTGPSRCQRTSKNCADTARRQSPYSLVTASGTIVEFRRTMV